MHPHPARRWLAGLAVAGALVATPTGAAVAAAPADEVTLYANDVTVAPGGPQKWVSLRALPDRAFGTYTVRVDRSAVAAFAEVAEDDRGSCTTAGDVITCAITDDGEDSSLVSLPVTARAGAEPGRQGTLAFTVTAPGVGTATYESTVSTGEGVDLVADRQLPLDGRPGARVDVPLAVTNRGTTTARGAVLYLSGSYGFTPGKRYSNCEYVDPTLDDSSFACTFDDELAPGETVRVDPTFGGTIPADAWAPNLHYSFAVWFTPADWAEFRAQHGPAEPFGRKGADAALKLVPAGGAQARAAGQTDTSPVDNETRVTLTVAGDQRGDAAAQGATVTGAVGATVPMTVGYRNNGPARVGPNGQRGLNIATIVTLPEGVTAVTVSKSCVDPDEDEWQPGKPGARVYECSARGTIGEGERVTFEFALRIDRAGSRTGTVKLHTFDGDGPVMDLDPTNDTAQITVKQAGGTGGGDDGSLPITGVPTGLIAGLGGLLVAAGAGGYLLARRRRTRFVA
ncbi:hypothetical protein GA0070558_12943 [Micromonospora haikouensis]|uniref:Cell wall anchor protein n=1 Tax=Micromonospora haikouensis TaxID=686309 RepID=A0A1C4XTM9_9ACTN|nr:cell wall anchor protein [Micromonospora haikouensis]SCF11461.1 hypothetical protein GA0070558_12943 [Micromonospora haikouensis]